MGVEPIEIKVKGKNVVVPSLRIAGKTTVVLGRVVRIAAIHDEAWIDGEAVEDPESFVSEVRRSKLKADILAFSQKLPSTERKYAFHVEWDNVAAIPITSYKEWWEKRLSQDTRRNVRIGAKRGVIAREVAFSDGLVRGIVDLHNESPTRQGLPFRHYGKDFNVVKQEYASFLDRSVFIGAYLGDELIGVIKFVCVGKIAAIMQILTKTQHYDKRPTNVLFAKAVELCEAKGMSYLTHGKYVYGNKTSSSLTEAKRRLGFERIDIPKYFIPLNVWGKVAIRLRFHQSLLERLPAGVIAALRLLRSKYYQMRGSGRTASSRPVAGSPAGEQ